MKINLTGAKKIKEIKGFGGSACWWSPNVKDDKTANEIAEPSELFKENLRLEDLLAPLPDEQAEVVRLHFTDDLSMAEIAEILDISRDTVKSRYRYAMAKLRNNLSHGDTNR